MGSSLSCTPEGLIEAIGKVKVITGSIYIGPKMTRKCKVSVIRIVNTLVEILLLRSLHFVQ